MEKQTVLITLQVPLGMTLCIEPKGPCSMRSLTNRNDLCSRPRPESRPSMSDCVSRGTGGLRAGRLLLN